MIDGEPNIEALREVYLEQVARETVEAFALDSFFVGQGDFDAHMDTMAGYLDVLLFQI